MAAGQAGRIRASSQRPQRPAPGPAPARGRPARPAARTVRRDNDQGRRWGLPLLGLAVVAVAGVAAAVVVKFHPALPRLAVPSVRAPSLPSLSLNVMPTLPLAVVHLQGASPASEKAILAAMALRPGVDLLTLDLSAVRRRVEAVGWVERARVIRLFPATVVVAVKERPLAALWEHAGRTVVIAANGSVVTQVTPAQFRGLPLLVGANADLAAPALLKALAVRPGLTGRLKAAVRVDGRRWDLMLKDGAVVSLPAEDQDGALRRLDGLARDQKILDLGLSRIDLRDPEMIIVRPRVQGAPAKASGV